MAHLDHATLQDMAALQLRLLRDAHNARNAVQHSGRPLNDAAFTVTLLSATADFCLDQVVPGVDPRDAIPGLVDVFRSELEKLVRVRAPAKERG